MRAHTRQGSLPAIGSRAASLNGQAAIYDAYCALLAQPDPIDLPARGRHWLCSRDPRQHPETLKRDLARAYVEHRKAAYKDESAIVSVRRSPLHLVGRKRA